MKVAYSPIYKYNHLPKEHRFPMDKYHLLPKQLLLEGVVDESDFFAPQKLNEEQILRTHTNQFWQKLKNGSLSRKEIRNIGFPFHPVLVDRGRYISHGTLECAKYALKSGVSLNIAGGTHHSFADKGEGFCIFNDFAITANELLHEGLVKQVLIIDLDVHQGNGTASIFKNDPRVYTFSIHGEHNYPLRKEMSDKDIGVPDGIKDDQYLTILSNELPNLIESVSPDIVLYLSGVDVIETDKLGRLGLTKNGCKERDRMVFEQCAKYSMPVAVSMGGGYSEKISDIIDAHTNTFKEAKRIFE